MDIIQQFKSTEISPASSMCRDSGWSLRQQILLSKFCSVVKPGDVGSTPPQGLLLKQEEFYDGRTPLGVNSIIYCFIVPKLTFRI